MPKAVWAVTRPNTSMPVCAFSSKTKLIAWLEKHFEYVNVTWHTPRYGVCLCIENTVGGLRLPREFLLDRIRVDID